MTLRAFSIRALFAAAVCLLAIPVSPSEGGPRGRGDFEFFMDEAVFRRPGGGSLQRIFIRFPNREIRFKSDDDRFHARVKVTLTIQDKAGKAQVSDEFSLDFFEEDREKVQSTLHFQTIIRSYQLRPGSYELYCSAEDLYSPKITVLGMVRGEHRSSTVNRLGLEVPDFDSGTATFSDPMFLWQVERGEGMPVYHPNPPRMYGLYRDTLQVYMELYLPDSPVEGRSYSFESSILDEKGQTVRASSIPLPPPEPVAGPDPPGREARLLTYPLLISEDLSAFAAGSYAIYAGVEREDELLLRARCGNFSVAWDLRTWELPRRDYLAEARFLLGDEVFESFQRKSPGEQESLLQELWREADPTPHTGINEAYEKFLERLDYVNEYYSDYKIGIFTDRGLIYMKYGKPDEVVVDVMPINRESLADALEMVRNRFHPVSFSTQGARTQDPSPSKDIIVDPRRLGAVGEGGNVAYPYELWIYNGVGDPLLPRDKVLEADIGLRFIFIDREGYGHYKLESSSSMLDK